jgi:hypothetical protein
MFSRLINALPRTLRFAVTYRLNVWGDPESRSGAGSSDIETQPILAPIAELLTRLQVQTLLDVPCGDFHWMRHLDFKGQYVGGDLVKAVVDDNHRRYGSPTRSFMQIDLLSGGLPYADLVLCRDCLVHLTNAQIKDALRSIQGSRAKFALLTTFIERQSNDDLGPDGWRPLNLQAAPFNLPPPVELIVERPRDRRFADKRLGLWRCEDL